MIQKGKKFFLKYKFYRRYATDFWGSLTRRRKKSTTMRLIAKRLEPQVRRKIRKIRKRHLRKKMYEKFALKRRYFNPNWIFNLSKISKESRKLRIKRLRYRGLLLAMKKKLRVYYGLRLKIKKLRKLSFLVKVKSHKFFSRILESRFDSLLLRSNFADTMAEARGLVLGGKARILLPRNKNRVTWFTLKNPSHRVPLYTPIELSRKWKLKRKNFLIKTLISKRFLSYPPKYIYVNYSLMHSFTLPYLSDRKIRYIFPANFSYLSGLSKYL